MKIHSFTGETTCQAALAVEASDVPVRGSVSGNPGLGRVRRHTGQFEHVHWPWAQVQLPVDVHPQSGILQGGGGGGGGGGLVLMG